MKAVTIIAITFVVIIGMVVPNVFAQEPQTCEDFDVEKFTLGKYAHIEDYDLLYELTLQGLNDRSQEVGRFIAI